jgi:hypothetical protein
LTIAYIFDVQLFTTGIPLSRIVFFMIAPLWFFVKLRTAFLTIDVILNYLVKTVIFIILIVCLRHTALGAGMFAIS